MYIVYYFNKKLAEKLKVLGFWLQQKIIEAMPGQVLVQQLLFCCILSVGLVRHSSSNGCRTTDFKTAVDIFRESSFSLSDGFDQAELVRYKETIEKFRK